MPFYSGDIIDVYIKVYRKRVYAMRKKDAPYFEKGCTLFRKRMHPFFMAT